jgi:hypothetical protein
MSATSPVRPRFATRLWRYTADKGARSNRVAHGDSDDRQHRAFPCSPGRDRLPCSDLGMTDAQAGIHLIVGNGQPNGDLTSLA